MTRWRTIPGFDYEVSNHGAVRNGQGRVLRSQTINSGYQVVHLYRDGVRHVRLVHRLVAEAFKSNPQCLPEVNHRDADKGNNRSRNLEWSTRLKNVAHSKVLGLCVEKPNARAVIGTKDGVQVRFPSQKDAEIAFAGRATSAISNCLRGVTQTAYGHSWSLA